MYQSDFPVDTPIPIFDPTLLAGIALIVLAVGVLTFYIGRHFGARGRDERWRDVPKTIHEAIKAKCVAAASAPSGELMFKAQDLVEEVQRRIGPVLAFGGPCAKALKAMQEALKGEPPEDKAKDKPHGGHAKGGHAGKDDKHGHGGGNHDEGHGRKSEVELELAAANVTILGGQTVVLTGHRPAPEPGHGHHEPEDEEIKVLDHKDYARQVRMAVVEFSDFWSRGDCLNELQRCQRVLTETAPGPKKAHDDH